MGAPFLKRSNSVFKLLLIGYDNMLKLLLVGLYNHLEIPVLDIKWMFMRHVMRAKVYSECTDPLLGCMLYVMPQACLIKETDYLGMNLWKYTVINGEVHLCRGYNNSLTRLPYKVNGELEARLIKVFHEQFVTEELERRFFRN